VRVAVVGVGLIGGSVGLAAARRLGAQVSGYDRDPDVLELARTRGAIGDPAASLSEAVAGAEMAFVAVPVGVLGATLDEVLAAAPADCVVSDVGSTKHSIVAGRTDQRYVGGHPLAGSETAGVEHAREDLFEGATWYLTPTSLTSGVLYERLHRALAGFGAQPAAIDPDTHDRLMASVSHLPHVLANVLVTQAATALREEQEAMPATGPSFRDATRVAGANGAIWTDIYLSNREALMAGIDETVRRLQSVRGALADADSERVSSWNDEARAHREALLEAGLAGGPVHELRASVPNRPGVIADIALALGRAGVNIVDMALSPSHDFSRGVVALWVRGDEDAARALELIARLDIAVTRA
jgi:prephenate dehydrogenase